MICPICLNRVKEFIPHPDHPGNLKCSNEGCENYPIPKLYADDYNSYPAIACSMIGLSGHGKTRYVDGLLQGIALAGKYWDSFSYQWLDEKTARTVKERRIAYENQQGPQLSTAFFTEPVIVRLSDIPRVGGCQLVFFDVHGEAFVNNEILQDGAKYVRHSPAVIWLNSLVVLDPETNQSRPVDPNDLTDMVAVFRQGMAAMGGDTTKQRVIFTITKADLYVNDADFPASARNILENDVFSAGASIWEMIATLSNDLEKWLRNRGYHNVINILKRQFCEVFFTVVSAQGSDQFLQPDQKFQPKGVLLPLFWLWRTQRPGVWIERDGHKEYASSLPLAVETVQSGETILLDPGIHFLPQPLTIRKSLRIVGQNAETTIIEGSAGPFLAGINIQEGSFSAESVTFRHQGNNPSDLIRVVAGRVDFLSCIFTAGKAKPDGKSLGNGLVMDKSATGAVYDCKFLLNHGNGILVSSDRKVVVTECDFYKNAKTGVSILTGHVLIVSCKFRINAYGIRTSQGAVAKVERSHFQECLYGISATEFSKVHVHNECEFIRIKKCALRLEDDADVICEQALFSGSQNVAIYVSDRGKLKADENDFSHNILGAQIGGSAEVLFRDNHFFDDNTDGIIFSGRSMAGCFNNEFTRMKHFGIIIEETARPELDGNVYSENKTGDIFIAASVHRSVVPDKPKKGQPALQVIYEPR